jgi:hypothetical protein
LRERGACEVTRDAFGVGRLDDRADCGALRVLRSRFSYLSRSTPARHGRHKRFQKLSTASRKTQ